MHIFLKKGLTFQNRYDTIKKMGVLYPAVAFGMKKATFSFFLHLII